MLFSLLTGITEDAHSAANATTSSGIHHWRLRLNTIKNSFLGSPRFHRRKLLTGVDDVSKNYLLLIICFEFFFLIGGLPLNILPAFS